MLLVHGVVRGWGWGAVNVLVLFEYQNGCSMHEGELPVSSLACPPIQEVQTSGISLLAPCHLWGDL